MNIGIVTTWSERGAAYVSEQFMQVLSSEHTVFIYARGGEAFAIGDPNWDTENVYWAKLKQSPFTVTVIDKREFVNWIRMNGIEKIIFNEQHWWEPIIWCRELGVKTVAYIDYYTEETIPLFKIYDLLICNTRRHFQAFDWHNGARYIPWGTNINLFKPSSYDQVANYGITFFHSCGMDPVRKGTDLLIRALKLVKRRNFKLIIHTQTSIENFHPDLATDIINLKSSGHLDVIEQTVSAPGLYFLGDVYVYPSRLEGIGLTIAEAISCGLPVIVPDWPPMNEFVEEDFGLKVSLSRVYSRYDGYYWPQNEVDLSSLANAMDYFIEKISGLRPMKLNARRYAEDQLCWERNSEKLLQLFACKDNNPIDDFSMVISQIRKFETRGLRKFNFLFLKFPRVFTFMRKMTRMKKRYG